MPNQQLKRKYFVFLDFSLRCVALPLIIYARLISALTHRIFKFCSHELLNEPNTRPNALKDVYPRNESSVGLLPLTYVPMEIKWRIIYKTFCGASWRLCVSRNKRWSPGTLKSQQSLRTASDLKRCYLCLAKSVQIAFIFQVSATTAWVDANYPEWAVRKGSLKPLACVEKIQECLSDQENYPASSLCGWCCWIDFNL